MIKISCKLRLITLLFILSVIDVDEAKAQGGPRSMKYTSRSETEAVAWQKNLRSKLLKSLKLEKLMSQRSDISFDAKVVRIENRGTYELREVEINSTPTRRIRLHLTIPKNVSAPFPAVVSIHGHGGKPLSVYDTTTNYKGFAHELASRGYVTIAPIVSQHDVYEKGNLLMGERLFDCLRSADYVESMKDVDKTRIGCAGLSLGGEMAMWLAAIDTRMQATVSSGFLTNMDQLEKDHCMCWKFPGLREHADFADIYSLIAPRALMCQNGLKEPPSQFYVPIAREAWAEVQTIYRDMKSPENIVFDVHDGPHEVHLKSLLNFFDKFLYTRSGYPFEQLASKR